MSGSSRRDAPVSKPLARKTAAARPARVRRDLAPHRVVIPSTVWRFLARFALASIPLFAVWELWGRAPYLNALARLFAVTARLAGFDLQVTSTSAEELHFALGDIGWSNRFGMTAVNTIALAGLLLATGGVSWRRRARMLVLGLGLLGLTHVIGLWTDILHVHLHTRARALADGVRALATGFGTFLFPLLIWAYLLRDRIAAFRMRSS